MYAAAHSFFVSTAEMQGFVHEKKSFIFFVMEFVEFPLDADGVFMPETSLEDCPALRGEFLSWTSPFRSASPRVDGVVA